MLPVYTLSPEQIEIRNLARDFANKEILPTTQLYEKTPMAQGSLLDKIGQSGLVNTRIPEEFGGMGLTLLETCLIAEEFAAVCSGISSIAEASELALTILLSSGSKEQKNKFLTELTSTNGFAGIALADSYENTNDLWAEEEGNEIILNGHSSLVLNATFAQWLIITCPFKEKAKGEEHGGGSNTKLSHFVVPAKISGLRISEPIQLLGRKAANAQSVHFNKIKLKPISRIEIPDSYLLRSDNKFDVLNLSINGPIISAGCLGLANAAFHYAKKYAQERETFGSPLYKHQAIAFMMADMRTDIEATRILIHAAINSVVDGKKNFKLAFSALTFALEMAARVSNETVQIFGAYGYTKDYPVEKLMRDAKTYQSLYSQNSKELLAEGLL